jgi:ABC-type glutathione transport system ATPase component
VSREIAVACLAHLDAATSTGDRRKILIAAYRTFPPEAAADLEEAVGRLDPEAAAEATDVIEAVRHRVSTGAP